MKAWFRLFAQVASVAAALFSARDAGATPNFPGAVQLNLGASSAPPCSLCHLCGTTGRGTVNTPWGVAMRGRGLAAFDENSLKLAVAAMENDRVDSDSDGVLDVDAVRVGDDPNPGGLCSTEDETIARYGCIGRIAPAGPRPTGVLFFAGALGIFLARSLRRRGRPRKTFRI